MIKKNRKPKIGISVMKKNIIHFTKSWLRMLGKYYTEKFKKIIKNFCVINK